MNLRDRLREAQRLLFFATPSQDLSARLKEETEPDITRILILASEKTATPSSALTPFLSSDPRLALAAARVLFRRGDHSGAKARLIQSLVGGDAGEAMEALETFAAHDALDEPTVLEAVRTRLFRECETGDPIFQTSLLSVFAPHPWAFHPNEVRLHPNAQRALQRLSEQWDTVPVPRQEFEEDLWSEDDDEYGNVAISEPEIEPLPDTRVPILPTIQRPMAVVFVVGLFSLLIFSTPGGAASTFDPSPRERWNESFGFPKDFSSKPPIRHPTPTRTVGRN